MAGDDVEGVLTELAASYGDDAPSGIQILAKPDRVQIRIASSLLEKVVAALVWLTVTTGPFWLVATDVLRPADFDVLKAPGPLTLTVLIWTCITLWAMHKLMTVRRLTLSTSRVSLVTLPWNIPSRKDFPLADIHQVDIDTIRKEHTDKHGETRTTFVFKVEISRVSTPRPLTLYSGGDERRAQFIRTFLVRAIADIRGLHS